MDTEELEKIDKHYLYSLQDFAEPEEEEIIEEDLPPPPPTFSEDELAAAKDDSFQQGRAQGLREALEKTEKKTADLLAQIQASFAMLLADEHKRQERFETEGVRGAQKAVETLFPLLAEQYGGEEIHNFILKALKNQSQTDKITISLHPDYLSLITDKIPQDENPHLTFVSKDTLDPLACEMAWTHGGAVQNMNTLCEEVLGEFKQLLEGRDITSHDDIIEDCAPQDDVDDKDTQQDAQHNQEITNDE